MWSPKKICDLLNEAGRKLVRDFQPVTIEYGTFPGEITMSFRGTVITLDRRKWSNLAPYDFVHLVDLLIGRFVFGISFPHFPLAYPAPVEATANFLQAFLNEIGRRLDPNFQPVEVSVVDGTGALGSMDNKTSLVLYRQAWESWNQEDYHSAAYKSLGDTLGSSP